MSTPQPSEREKDIFLDATELPAEQRTAFVESECGGDAAAVERVRKLLAAHDRAERVLDGTDTASVEWRDELQPGSRIGGYTLVREIAEGGFGTVWLAEQREPVRRPVALKVLRPGIGTRDVIARFEAERQALAVMDHPNIARVFDGGATDTGRPFFVMEFVDGEPITEYCARHLVGVEDRLKLFATVCDAVQHAHQKGVIHRDIKPNNVLVGSVDGKPFAKVIDFGIAKATEIELTDKTVRTRGQLIGTPAYMSPEQADGSADIDTRTDVYSLGVLLYELISGAPPFEPGALAKAGLAETLRVIREDEPPLPSARLGAGSGESTIMPKSVRGDLDWITMRCLEKDRQRRYGSVSVLANEIARHLRGDPVLAGPPNLRYRVGKFARKHRAALATATVLALTLIAATVVSWSQAEVAREQAANARRESERAAAELNRYRAVAAFTEHLFASIDPSIAKQRDTELLHELLDLADRRIDQLMEGEDLVEAALRRMFGHAYRSIGVYDKASRHLERALEIRAAALGPDHVDRLESIHDLGVMRLQMHDTAAAIPLLEEAATKRAAALGPDHPDALSSLGQYATGLRIDGRFEKSAEILERVVEHCRELYGESHESTLTELNNLGATYEDLGRLDEAASIFERVVRHQARKRGTDDERTLKTLTNLASVYHEQGKLDAAGEILEQTLEIKRRLLPAGHPSLLTGMNNLAAVWRAIGEGERAHEMLEDALALAREHHGERNRFTVAFRVLAAQHRFIAGDAEGAARELEQLRPLALELLGPRHQLIAVLDCLEVDLLLDSERFDEAVEAAESSLSRHAELQSNATTNSVILQIQRGLALEAIGRKREALQAIEKASTETAPISSMWQKRRDDAISRLR